MVTFNLVFQQLMTMLFLVFLGWLLTKRKMLTASGVAQLSTVLLYLVVPAVIIGSFLQKRTHAGLRGLGFSFLYAVLFHLGAIGVSRFFCKTPLERLASVYSNCGFMAFPILAMLYGESGIFYGSAFVSVFNVCLWSHGYRLLRPQAATLKKAFLNPGFIPVMLGLVLYLWQIPVPSILQKGLTTLAGANTSLAMIVIGSYLARVESLTFLKCCNVWKISFLRLLFLPSAFGLGVAFLQNCFQLQVPASLLVVAVICSACPTASSVVIIPSSLGMDSQEGAEYVFLTSLLALLTLPFMTFFSQHIAG